MLKKLAVALGVNITELINGYSVNIFPNKIENIKLTFVKKHDGDVFYDELPNWFIKIKENEDICFAMYDKNKRDYSYHLHIDNKLILHNEECYEVICEEYGPKLNHESTYTYFVKTKDNKVSFIGRSYIKDNIKHIETFKDKEFLSSFGFNGENIGQSMVYDDAEEYVLTYLNKNIDVIKISYFDNGGTSDDKHFYFETFLNKKGESLYWRRFIKSNKNKVNDYVFDYECITNRLLNL